jgi:hypothetical protein
MEMLGLRAGKEMMSLLETLGNEAWLRANEQKVKDMLPETWTHVSNLNGMQLGYRMKLLGIDWRSEEQLAKVMVFLTKTGFLLMNGQTVRRNPNSVFKA